MPKGYFEMDEESIAWGFFGVITAMAVGDKVAPKVKPQYKALGGLAAGLALRAAVDPKLTMQRKA